MSGKSPHKWGVFRLTFNQETGRPCSVLVSRHKTQTAALKRAKGFDQSVRRLETNP